MFLVEVDKVITNITQVEQMTSGSQNVYVVNFKFSNEWAFLKRTAVFRQGETIVNILLDDDNRCMIPWEVMQTPFVEVEVGVFGVKGDDVVLPTVWASMGSMLQGVITGEEPLEPPTPSVYEQLLSKWTTIEEQIGSGALSGPQGESAYDIAVKDGFKGTAAEWLASLKGQQGISGQNGNDGEDGKSAYQIAVDSGFEGTKEDWLASLQGPPGEDGRCAGVIDRCIWVTAAGNDISLFSSGETNIAAPDEFIGHSPTVGTNNIGLVLVDSKLYWITFDIVEATENAVTQVFTQNPMLIGPVAAGNMSESTLFVVNYNRAPKVGDYFNITPDRMYGAIPKNGEDYTLVAFTTDGIFDCTCVVTDYTPGKWATQVRTTTVSGINVYGKDKIDEMLANVSAKDSLITIKDTTITNVSQLPTDKLPCCIHLINSYLGFLYKDDIVYVKSEGPLMWVYTINGAIAKLTVGLEGQINTNQVDYTATKDYVDSKFNDVASSSGSQEVYSTEEIRIGTWIDGKPMYRRVITGLTFSSGEAKEYASYGKTALQIDTVVGLAGTAFVDTGEVVSLPYTDFSSIGGALTVDLHLQIKDDALLVVNRNANAETKWKASSAIAILEYTKTTDQSEV